MKKMKFVLTFLVAILLIFIGYAGYMNVFKSIEIEDRLEGGYVVVGLDHIGPYSEAGNFMTEVKRKLENNRIRSKTGFGIYYDDPKVTAAKDCRSYVGAILEEKDRNRISDLKLAGFRVDSISKTTALVSYFPIKSSLSYMIGPMKVYSEFNEYIDEKGYDVGLVYELYDNTNSNIMFVMQYVK